MAFAYNGGMMMAMMRMFCMRMAMRARKSAPLSSTAV